MTTMAVALDRNLFLAYYSSEIITRSSIRRSDILYQLCNHTAIWHLYQLWNLFKGVQIKHFVMAV